MSLSGEAVSEVTSAWLRGAENADRLQTQMLTPQAAWRLLRRETGGSVSRATFYRWLGSGRVYSVRMGYRIYVPGTALDYAIKKCLEGERI